MNKLEQMALMCSGVGAENQGSPNDGAAAGKPQQCQPLRCQQPQMSSDRSLLCTAMN